MKTLLLFLSLTLTCWASFDLKSNPVTSQYISFTHGTEQREVKLKLYLPTSQKTAPVILLSHGLGGTKDSASYLGEHWAARGFVVVAMQHIGSDRQTIRSIQKSKKMPNNPLTMGLTAFLGRIKDVKATVDQLHLWDKKIKHPLYKRCDLEKIGIAGHSFGAITAQALTGQNYPIFGNTFQDSRIKAAFCMSPYPAMTGNNKDAFSKITTPWLLATGTRDLTTIGKRISVAQRKAIYQIIPQTTECYQLVLNRANHMAFHDFNRYRKAHSNANHHRALKTISTVFFASYLKDNAKAKTWLRSNKVNSVLQQHDSWQWR